MKYEGHLDVGANAAKPVIGYGPCGPYWWLIFSSERVRSAEEVDPDIAGVKHNMSIHLLKRKKVTKDTAEAS